MLREPYSAKSYSYNSKYIDNRLALRPPQKESLERFARIVDILSLSKTPNLDEELLKIRELFPTLTSFERDFPSVCFALATGIGKTRLMGAMIAYLHYEKGINNFFVMAPNLTIYKKLKNDLGNQNNEKYVFRGLDKFVNAPRIIDGDNYEEFRQMSLFEGGITINVFNISKLNSESGRIVKPFVLVVAKDTNHSREIREYLTSDAFFHGYYKDKVLEINSAQRGSEKDENIEMLLSLELTTNVIEIVIHVNMLKEGWDVTNLYTIVPLRASASETLTEQTIGRGLRLPYGQRAGVDEVDRLSIVSHDRYQAIVDLAKDPNSLVRKVYYIEEQELPASDDGRETVPLPTVYDTLTSGESFTQQLAFTLRETATDEYKAEKTPDQTMLIASIVQSITAKTVVEVNRQVRNINAINDEQTRKWVHSSIVTQAIQQLPELGLKEEDLTAVVMKAIETCAQALTENVIPIPQSVIQPHTEVKRGFYDFTLDTSRMRWHPSDDTLLGTELMEGGETFTLETGTVAFAKIDTVENEIVRHIIIHDNVDYATCSDLIYSLIADAKRHFLSYLNDEEAEKVMRDRQRTIAEIIYAQMNEHFYKEEVSYRAANMRPFIRIEPSFGGKFKSDKIYDLRTPMAASDVKSKIFSGFKKAGHTLYKFDSDTERTFAVVLENDKAVLRWLRPAPRQFNIYWGQGGANRYEPDFIVETADTIYMCEPKASNKMRDADVLEKQEAAEEYCRAASEFNTENGGKPWKYVLISHDEIRPQSSFTYLAKQGSHEQLTIE